MLLLECLIFTTVIASILGGCDKNGILIYEDFGCTPHYEDGKDCPSKYSCDGSEPSSTNCYFRGKTYQDSEAVDSTLASPSCNAGCHCRVEGNKTGFVCAILDCPEWLGVPVKYRCYRKYSPGECCSVGQICYPFDGIEKCMVYDKEYQEGQRFSIENSCLDCVCQKGLKGKFEFAPFYAVDSGSSVLCCPDSWICSDGSESSKGKAKSEETCKFGEKTFKVGEEFEKFDFTDN
ncbi:uncharacterized protein [Tenebrio molitor]|uniref:uncharacterized protein n=1 Tax=Tenebrio molitor TaxID=7067 RepID=UPI003624AACC